MLAFLDSLLPPSTQSVNDALASHRTALEALHSMQIGTWWMLGGCAAMLLGLLAVWIIDQFRIRKLEKQIASLAKKEQPEQSRDGQHRE